MANHSLIEFPRPVSVAQIEEAFHKINGNRFQGRMALEPGQKQSWAIEAPGTRPSKPSPAEPDENLGFLLWLHENGRALEFRHNNINPWLMWVEHVFEHEFANHFEVRAFDQGDGIRPTDLMKFRTSFYDYVTRAFTKPLTDEDLQWLQPRFFDHVPLAWR